ncbi:MAG: diphthine--ammonia ligase [Chitinophagaceae bacterium]|nr:diphthine--ammonia ligase [Chitinophagaceae bacterium]MCA6454120.1 diphthine--ammonia ligase [Chitinophagaceae bacterium]MCA6456136.1 diphthine--ammonia ligase [Chitinophagaceae bacterium]MCA6457576.1 diphthine--ammonia ligase [Chitinophagaceae bacterium]MCA6463289.1 diphthine--ammonia ligase [Chitinophagaceae bacterium]
MTDQAHILCSWSGGKDSCFALIQAIQEGYRPQVLLNVLNEEGRISRSHGIPANILQAQAAAMQLPIHLISSSWQEYEAKFVGALQQLTQQYSLTHAVFGDIDLQAHRDWEEKVCAQAGLTALLPLWQQNRKTLVYQMLDAGIETMIVSCNTTMGERFLGKMLTTELVNELESLGVDVCGENGEFHTLVLNCPIFNKALKVKAGKKLLHNGYWFTELTLS